MTKVYSFFFGGGAAFKGEAALYGLPSMLNHSTGSPVDIQIGSPDQSLEAMENSPPVFFVTKYREVFVYDDL